MILELPQAFDVEGDAPFTMGLRGHPFPGEYLTVRRIALLALMLEACRQSQATLDQLHVLNWAVRTRSSRELFLRYIAGDIPPDTAIVRFDPTLPRVVQFGLSEGVVSEGNQDRFIDTGDLHGSIPYRLRLTPKGREVANSVVDDGVLVVERMFLEQVGNKVTQRLVRSLLQWR